MDRARAFVGPLVTRVGLDKAARIGAAALVCGLAVYGLLGRFGYVWVVLALVLVAAGMRVVGVVAGTNVMRGLPADRTTIGAALVDTAGEVTAGIGIAVSGTVLAALFAGDIATSSWSAHRTTEFHEAVTLAGLTLTALAATLVGGGVIRARRGTDSTTPPAADADAEQPRGTSSRRRAGAGRPRSAALRSVNSRPYTGE